MALEKELATYKSKLPELKDSEGKFVLIHGEELVDTYTSFAPHCRETEAPCIVTVPLRLTVPLELPD
jgi:hypothetical protein